MFGTSVAVFLLALAALRFPDVPLLAILPAVAATAVACMLPRDRGAWIGGLIAGALLFRLPGGMWLGIVTALLPLLATLVQRAFSLHPALVAAVLVPVAAYVSGVAGSGGFLTPLLHPLDLCAAVALGATLSAIAYAPTERERLGPRGRAGLRVR